MCFHLWFIYVCIMLWWNKFILIEENHCFLLWCVGGSNSTLSSILGWRIKWSKTLDCLQKKGLPVWTRAAWKINRWGHCIERDQQTFSGFPKHILCVHCTDLLHFQTHRCDRESQAILKRSKYRNISKNKEILNGQNFKMKNNNGSVANFCYKNFDTQVFC